jgi:predicted dehydrogenase
LVDESYLYMPSHEAAVELIESNRVGSVRSVAMTFYGWLPLLEFRAAVAAANEGWRAVGEFPWITDHAVHFFALSRRFSGGGPIEDVRALGGTREDDVVGATWRCGNVSVVWLRITNGLEGVWGPRTGLHTLVVGERGFFTVLGEGGAWGDGGPRSAIRFHDASALAVGGAPDLLWEADVGYYPSAHIRSVRAALAGGGGGYPAQLAFDDLVATQSLIQAARRVDR